MLLGAVISYMSIDNFSLLHFCCYSSNIWDIFSRISRHLEFIIANIPADNVRKRFCSAVQWRKLQLFSQLYLEKHRPGRGINHLTGRNHHRTYSSLIPKLSVGRRFRW
jgi:hypothetical protein